MYSSFQSLFSGDLTTYTNGNVRKLYIYFIQYYELLGVLFFIILVGILNLQIEFLSCTPVFSINKNYDFVHFIPNPPEGSYGSRTEGLSISRLKLTLEIVDFGRKSLDSATLMIDFSFNSSIPP